MTTSNEFDPVEPKDLNKLAQQVFRQSLEDYLHLQHPSVRTKKYVHEAFLSAVDMFWDPDYSLDSFSDENNEPMGIIDFMKLSADRENLDIEALQKFLIVESEKYWKDKMINTVTIPDIMMICSVPYDVSHIADAGFRIDYENRVLFINRKPNEINNQEFMAALIEIICYHHDLRISKVNQKVLGIAMYEILKINNSFKEPKA